VSGRGDRLSDCATDVARTDDCDLHGPASIRCVGVFTV